jgi:hypothetical protein
MCRLITKSIAILSLLPLGSAAYAAAPSSSYDLGKSEPRQLTGMLSYRIFPGPPHYKNVQKGDIPEPSYVLLLPQAICLKGDDKFADPKKPFGEVQLVATTGTADALAGFKGKEVTVTLDNPTPAQTGHHHEPLVAWVTDVAPAIDLSSEYGTPATTVRAYYLALAAGDGATAAKFVVPEKSSTGPLSATELSAFYGHLIEPLQLVSVTSLGAGKYLVSYNFKSTERVCNGRAEVATTKVHGADFIQSIRALAGC